MCFKGLRLLVFSILLTGCLADYKTGEQLYLEGDYQEAIEVFDQVLFISSTDLKTLHLRARSFEELGKFSEAISDYKKILTLDPTYAYAYAGIAKIAWDKEDFKKAEQNLLLAAMHAPQDYDILLFLGRALIKSGRYTSAVEFFDLAIALKPEEANPHYYQGIANAYAGDGLGVIVSFNKYIELAPNNISAHYNRGFALMKFGYKEWAVEDFDKVLELEPKHYEALARRAVCLMDKNPRQSCFDLETAALNGNDYARYHQAACEK